MKYIDSCLRKMLAAAVLFAVTGCISLDEDIDAQPTSDKFFDETEDYYNFLMSGYTSMIQLYGSDELYCLGAGAEDIYVPIDRWKGFEYADINSVGNPDELTNNPWNLSYKTIGICNTMLQIVRDSDLSPTELAPIVGEAKFLRALAYFNMTRWFKEVPLITEDNMTEAATHPDTPVADIYAQIVSDLTAAEGSLPDGRGGEDFFRPRRGRPRPPVEGLPDDGRLSAQPDRILRPGPGQGLGGDLAEEIRSRTGLFRPLAVG